MTLKDSVKTLLEKSLPKSWPWEPGPTAKRLVWMIHMTIVFGTVVFGVFTAYLLFSSALFEPKAPEPPPETTPQGGGPQGATPQGSPRKPPLPYWIRVFKSFSFLVSPLVSYLIYYTLPEPDDGSE